MADPAIQGVLRLPFAQQVAFFRGKLGNLVPTTGWRDLMRQQQDRAFMVAGAQNADLLAGLAASIDRLIAQGTSIEDFRRDFRELVRQTGWDPSGEFNQRTRTIYGTNMRTSYAAGRTAQLREGGFPFLLYKHGGSADPRPQHLAWDGLVLPADHAFWQTHTPPNGWGCSCRVVGLRRLEDARQLGGDPSKALPEGWDARDPATGAPKGIDEGWDYKPGDTVADIVEAMAAKTQQWEYSLAKAYMEEVPEAVRDRLAEAYRRLPSVAEAARVYAQGVLEKLPRDEYFTLGLLTSPQAARVQALKSVDVARFDYTLDRFGPQHVRDHHGNEAIEARRGQRAVSASDYARLPAVLNTPDAIEDAGSSKSTSRPLVLYRKRFGSEELVAVFELRKQRRMLALETLYIRMRKP